MKSQDLHKMPDEKKSMMFKLFQLRSEAESSVIALGQNHLNIHFKRFEGFVREALYHPDAMVYVKDSRWDMNSKKMVRKGTVVTFVLPTLSKNIATAAMEKMSLVFQDQGLLVVNKSSSLPSQATFKPWEDNMFHQILCARLIEKNFPKVMPYVGMHHRLDRDTSGLMIFSEKKSNNKELSDLFKSRKILKKYWTIVEDSEEKLKAGDQWSEDGAIDRLKHQKHKFKFGVVETGGQEALTQFKVISQLNNPQENTESGETSKARFLLECYPKTGRTHQIRVHLRHKGLKIVGDPIYGTGGKQKPMRLHAQSLKFKFNNKEMDFSALPSWPENLGF